MRMSEIGGTIVAIVGATATGKTDLGERLAGAIDGEVVCADSRQVFADLDIGTGKPAAAERAAIPHHLFDALALDEPASAGWYARAAAEACLAIHARGRVAVLVGGSGLYVNAARRGLAETPPADPPVRAALRAVAEAHGAPALHARLAREDPETAARLAPADAQRIIRALEVLEVSGRPLSWWHRRPRGAAVPGDWRLFEVTCPPDTLRTRIERRTRAMFADGLIEETRALIERGLAPDLRRLAAIGYDEAMALIEGRVDRTAAEERTSLRTLQLAKRQRTWFRHQIEAVRIDGAGDAWRPLAEACGV
jgi:tRNA dimethylallyltransferase